MTALLPFVSMCLATSLDGRIATSPGAPPDFTSPEDLARLFRLRAQSDILMMGASTVRSEQVLPLVRNEELAQAREDAGLPRHPAAIVVSGSLDLPWDGRYFRYRKQRMLILTGSASAENRQRCQDLQVELLETGASLNLRHGLEQLHTLGFRNLLAEGGGGLIGSLLQENLIDRAYLTIAPVFIGGDQTPRLVAGPQLDPLRRFKLTACNQIGDELHTTYDRSCQI